MSITFPCRDCGETFSTSTDAERCPGCSALMQGDLKQALLYFEAFPAMVRRPGKFEGCGDQRIGETLHAMSLDGYCDCESWDDVGEWYAAIGRYVVSEDDRGFFWYSRERSGEYARAIVGALDGEPVG